MERDGAEVTCDGRLFHRRAAATGNAVDDGGAECIEWPEILMRWNAVVV